VPLRTIETVVLPPHRAPGGFDHATVHPSADRLYVAHTANDTVEVIDLGRRIHAATLEKFPGVAGAAVSEERSLLVCTCRGEGTVSLAALDDLTTIRRVHVGARPNGLSLVSHAGLALAACLGDRAEPSLAIVDLDHAVVLASAPLPGRPRWAVHDPIAGCFYLNIAAPPQILVVSAVALFDFLRSIPIPVAGPHGLDIDRTRGLLHCACDGGAMVTVEAASGHVVAQVPLAGAPDVVFFNSRRDRLYVAIGDPGVLRVIDAAAGRMVETIPTGKGAKTLGFDAEREHVFAFLPATHSATVFAEV
jgi:DNA-binding beta-propeller fold protein YncE